VNWQLVDNVFAKRPEWSVANYWAPEIAAYKGRYYVYYVGRKKGGPLAVAVATADKPQGPYTDHGVLVSQAPGSIDPVPFDDENGERYLIWKEDGNSKKIPTILWAQKLNEDGTKLVGEMKEILRNDAPWEGAVVEGPFVVKHENWFYIFYSGSGCCGAGCNYALGVARSHSLRGPYEKCPRNPILAGNEHWKCPGHGSIVQDERGRYFLMYHAYATKDHVFTGRQALLDEVKFEKDDWPSINNGKGPSSEAASPYAAREKKAELSFIDDFDDGRLRAGWQWPVADEPRYEARAGTLILRVCRPTNELTAGILARTTTTGDYTADTIVDMSRLEKNAFAGLSAFGDRGNAVGLAAGEGKLVLWRREKGQHKELDIRPAPDSRNLRLRLMTTAGHQFKFSASGDGKQWIPVGDDVEGKHLPPWDRNVRVALTVGGAPEAAAVFDSFRISSAIK
jgi:beta-xylosidase